MIQDDPINKILANKSKLATHNDGYFPLNVDSEEEIAVQGIEVKKDGAKDGQTEKLNQDISDKSLYYKYAMLIGLCNNNDHTIFISSL